VINPVSEDTAQAMNITTIERGADASELFEAKLKTCPSVHIKRRTELFRREVIGRLG
jgi:hypothetical protein